MKMRSIFFFLICIGFIAGCSTVYEVKYDYNMDTDFSKYKTYDWMPVPAKADMDELIVARIKKAVAAELSAKGLERTTQNPDFLIAEHIGKKQKQSVMVDDWGYGYAPYAGYWGGYWGSSGISIYQYEEGALILDFVDAASKKLVWRGSGKAEVQDVKSPEESEKLINTAVEKILGHYPPPAK